ncbi:probable DNA double-strand break repair Rad50 ATPase [Cuculus canorus]|uniref:probable DNA double-strand break repair Rad50 ATPase n=1 Tax=Cuculus canorus TaxID=55661 RepID=UPI0023AAA6E5|nr:probable DNA double-strand break repair Rad50 ATPase [Cuculus canorus]
MLLRERDQGLNACEHPSEGLETNPSSYLQVSKAGRRERKLEKEVGELRKALQEKTTAIEKADAELHEAQRQIVELRALQLKEEQRSKDTIRKVERLQKQLSQLQRENRSLREQLAEMEKIGRERMG